MKEIKQIIEYCNCEDIRKSCPHFQEIRINPRVNDNNSYFQCSKKRKDLKSNNSNRTIEIPTWCPLDDVEDTGAKVGTAIFLVKDGNILLGKRKNTELGPSKWALPGGRVDFGEELKDAIIREVKEETNLDVNEAHLLDCTNNVIDSKQHWVTFFYYSNDFSGSLENIEEDKCYGWTWIDIDALPDDTYLGIKKMIGKLKKVLNERC